MNNIYRYILITLFGVVSSACLQIDEQYSENDRTEELVEKTFIASLENGSFTKTILDGEVGEGTHNMFWCPEDKIAIVPIVDNDLKAYTFYNKSADYAKTVEFEGSSSNAETYWAFYPAGNLVSLSQGSACIHLPVNVDYKDGIIAHDGFPMAAKVQSGNDLSFSNLCGIFALRLTGTQTVKSITFETDGTHMVAGNFNISFNDEGGNLLSSDGATSYVNIHCGYEGVTLKEEEATLFYFVLPPQVYETFNICILTTDGGIMYKHATKPLEIKRSFLTASGALSYVESPTIDLSKEGTSNTYIISEANLYSFDASVIGNGNDGIIQDAGFHTDAAEIEPSAVDVLWSEPSGLISNLNYNQEKRRIIFTSAGIEGNAVIVAKDEQGDIIWSWHIWSTDEPKEQYYKNSIGEFHILDRNLGATRADRGDGNEWEESVGTLYQWGRKDPTSFSASKSWRSSEFNSIADVIKYPNTYTKTAVWLSPMNSMLWSASQKTIYDPCPVGYRVANNDSYTELATTGTNDYGWNLDYGDGVTLWYPATPYISNSGTKYTTDNIGYIWSADQCSSQYGNTLHYSSTGLNLTRNRSVADHYPVRCMKDEDYFTLEVPLMGGVEVQEVTSESAVVSFNIRNEGASEVMECGIIYGTTSGDLLNSGTKLIATDGEYQVGVTGLPEGTEYYVMAYAVNSYGTSYSKEIKFRTRYANGVYLSENGTSNCYIITEPEVYMFDASVMGNSDEPVGELAEVEVLWETRGVTPAETGEIIKDVQLSGDQVMFESTGVEGNALIAVKDASGNILWSWHIWATDEPVEHHYVGSDEDFYVLDRNVGSVRADRGEGDEWKESVGTQYQRGRKDPFVKGLYTVASSPYSTVEQSIANPTEFSSRSSHNWLEPKDYTLWSADEKTKYDPCPLGYRVATRTVFSCLKVCEAPGNGLYFYYDGENAAWYPGTPHNDCFGTYMNESGSYAYMWVANATSTSSYEVDTIYYSTSSSATINSTTRSNGDTYPVRCMKE